MAAAGLQPDHQLPARMNIHRYQRIYDAVGRIPAGTVSSYGAVAQAAGMPGRARLVGKALQEAPPGITLPWYRVVRSDGRVAFPVGSEGFQEQSSRLLAEGVRVRNGRVDLKVFGWHEDLDRLLWGPKGRDTSN